MELDFQTTSKTLLGRLARPERTGEWKDAWALFVKTYGPPILRLCKRTGVRETDLEDVSQEILLKLMSSMATFECRRWLKVVVERAVSELFDELEQAMPGSDEATIWQALVTAGREPTAARPAKPARDKLVAARVRQLLAQQTPDERERFRSQWSESAAEIWQQACPDFDEFFAAMVRRCCPKWGLEEGLADKAVLLLQPRFADALATLDEESLPRFRDWLKAVVRNAARDCLKALRAMAQAGDARIIPLPADVIDDEVFEKEIEMAELRLEAEMRVQSSGRVSERDWVFYTKMVHEQWTAPEVSKAFSVANGAAYMAVKRVRDKVAEQMLLLMEPKSTETPGEES